ncbi:hypothetical protein N7468_003648 [Penicillium chermesinum]|uniref:Rab-GAP TBC domain-containing protein n=1 Tax=Penicillium chermesinum TaxID=63820 RepID=A0A9W9P6U4_9EURO|nr:uncharacterized protein N7468_003648 [Penicillium chermesinum]KAJ5239029.1 hypothetical protein N7468_003648 [Penicillium chermesinum]
MAEPDLHPQRRSSSQASSASTKSQRARTLRAQVQKRNSTSSNTTTDLTSFPSLSPPDRSPTLARGLTNALAGDDPDGINEAGTRRGRKGTLAKLTTGIPNNPGRAALFDDSVLPHDVPGALHLAEDTHIERLIASTGPVKIVRQFARDLAQRDAEISALRQRADARERELKRMLREVSVSNQDIERRLYQLENPIDDRNSDEESTHSGDQSSQHSAGLNGLMSQAMADAVGSQAEDEQPDLPSNFNATIRALRAEDGVKQAENAANRKRQGSLRGWGDYLFGTSAATSRKTSRASSIVSDMKEIEEDDGTEHPRVASNPPRRKALDEQLFQPPGQLSSNGAKQRLTSNSANGDDASVHSRKSSRSIGSWTIKLFAGGSQSKDSGDSEANSDYAAASDQNRNPSAAAPKTPMSAVASLKRIDSSTKVPSARGPSGMNPAGKKTPSSRRNPAGSVAQGNAAESTELSSTNLGPVEMDAILPVESRPPSLAPIYNKSLSQEYLTDRFGFIYDQRRKKRQREATPARPTKPPLNIAETLGNLRADASDIEDGNGEQNDESVKSPVSPPGSPIDPDSGSVGLRRWQDYLRIPSRPTELLSHTPSAAPIVSLTTASESRPHSGSVSVDKDGSSLSFQSSAQPSALTSTITADSPEFAGSSQEPSVQRTVAKSNTAETEPVKLLLEQLTDLHDNLQRDRAVRWNEFLRKVRAERRKEGEAAAAATSSDRTSLATVDTPEASLTDGEVVGIAGLGNKGKVGRAKWREFRALVLGGIPVALRAKVWSECSGASGMRIPGYYDDLVRGVGGDDPDPSVVAQIDMDIRRTLTDNVFFRKGPGVAKLKEVLLAYSRRNAEVGYCQGMNLIAASLLLIMPTAEDAFWILASMIEMILPQHYYDHGLLASRADQVVLRQYISEILPNLSAHLEELGIELEALTFQWFLSLFTDCLSAEALYRVWDVVLCLNVTSTIAPNGAGSNLKDASDKAVPASDDFASGSGGGSTFLFQVALALLKLNEPELLTTCSTPAALYTYINHQMTNHAISIDGLIQASEALRNVVRREDVVSRRAVALDEMRRMSGASP